MKSKGAPISLSFSISDSLLTDEGEELTLTAKDDSGTKETTVVIPWSDDDPPKELKPQG
jgi:hypothetical protein